ncbi:MAG: RDD family protein [Myxococcales bacterium]|jgi:uncharacterized RDD family membrane protein YckC|nr:RDD family protein [Myxococcales bacterium]HRC56108.1 RDD family protein [Kofleriaceae bacterium]
MARIAAARSQAMTVVVRGFWIRAVAGLIDLAIILPTAAALGWITSKLSGVSMPAMNLSVLDIDLWLDLVLAADPGLVMGIALCWAIGLAYLTLFTITRGQTVGMKVMKMKVIDVYGDPPSPRQCLGRVAGAAMCVATLGLGFVWVAFDSEKRGLHDWIAGTYVVRT